MNETKERPILMSAPMVRACLDGTKSQTRRIVKWRNVDAGLNLAFTGLRAMRDRAGAWALESNTRSSSETRCDLTVCPYGHPGDRLWVRETWQYADWTEDGYPFVQYRADNARLLLESIPDEWAERLQDTWVDLSAPANYGIDNRAADRKWRPAIHIPRWACRLELEVTDVRVERLQAISDADSLAEGVDRTNTSIPGYAKERYRQLWESINGVDSWDANPWVWVVSFKRPQKEVA